MFEKNHFITINLENPLTQVSERDAEIYLREYKPENMSLSAFQGSFLFLGSAQMLVLHPLPPGLEQELCYLQSFVLMHMGESYYTERKDYASYLMLYTYEGEGRLTYEGETYSLRKDDVFLIDCRKPHTYHTEGGHWVHGDLHFDGPGCGYIYQDFEKNGIIVSHCASPEHFQNILETLLSEYESPSPQRDIFVSSRIFELLRFLLQTASKQAASALPETIVYLLRYMESNYNQPLSLDSMAAFAGISKFYLAREFKKYVGYSPNNYLIHLRLTHAKQLLHTTNLPAYKIGILVGIPNEINFSRLFKKHTGTTPGIFRKTRR